MSYLQATNKNGEKLLIPEQSIKYVIDSEAGARIQLNDGTVLTVKETAAEIDTTRKPGLT